jgi:hydroxymethylpyrimidine/phosphomethylpyrimidine kinase
VTIYRDKPPSDRSVLICSGLDPSGGAGFIADTRVIATLGARPIGVVTALTVQNTLGVQNVAPCDAEIVGAQLGALLGDIEVQAVKIGLLGSVQVAKEIAYGLDQTAAPVVWDPVAAPSRGRVVFDADSFLEMLKLLAPHVRLVTPNLIELGLFVGTTIVDRAQAEQAARILSSRAGGADVLVKGGHAADGARAVDLLVMQRETIALDGERITGEDVHGTGCALSSAIATYLAQGVELPDACRAAKDFVAAQIATAVRPGRGAPAVL